MKKKSLRNKMMRTPQKIKIYNFLFHKSVKKKYFVQIKKALTKANYHEQIVKQNIFRKMKAIYEKCELQKHSSTK